MSRQKYQTEAAALEKKCRTWKANPRRSLGLPSTEEFNRYVDGFSVSTDVHEEPKRRISYRPKRLTKPQENKSMVDIKDYSSSEDSDLDDIQPLDDERPPSHKCNQPTMQVLSTFKRKRTASCLVSDLNIYQAEKDVNITDDSPAKPAMFLRIGKEEITDINAVSPAEKGKGDTKPLSQQSTESMQEYSISDYASQKQITTPDSEELWGSSNKVSETDSLPISTASSPSEDNPHHPKKKTSHWLQSLQWEPDNQAKNSDDDYSLAVLEDSAKKKKQRYVKNGLADRLQTMVRRKQSTQNMWNHKMAMNQDVLHEVSKSLQVELLSVQWTFSVMVCQCRQLSLNQSSVAVNVNSEEPLTVFFDATTANRLGLKPGALVQIHPPWQSLNSQLEGRVILCTHFCHKLPSTAPHHSTTPARGPQCDVKNGGYAEKDCLPRTVVAQWECPCIKEGTFPRKTCQAQIEPCVTNGLSQPIQDITFPGTPVMGGLHTEFISQSESQAMMNIHESIENQGGFGAWGIMLRATVQRVFCKRATASTEPSNMRSPRLTSSSSSGMSASKQISLLLQDSMGMCCEVILPPYAERHSSWSLLCEEGEGKVWSFTGLRQHCRLNKNRDPALFQLINSISPTEGIAVPGASSQNDSQQSQAHWFHHTPCQTFCYRLMAASGESSCRLIGPAPLPRPSLFYTLSDVIDPQTTDWKPRFSILCKVILIYPQDSISLSAARYWYVVDSSLQSEGKLNNTLTPGYSIVTIQPSFLVCSEVLEELTTQQQPVLLIKDVLLKNRQYICDGYSRVYPSISVGEVKLQLNNNDLSHLLNAVRSVRPCITSLCDLHGISTNDLVTVQGVVSGVNENTAYTWEVCDLCQSTDLHPHSLHSIKLFCRACGQRVAQPEIKVNLEVFVVVQLKFQSDPVKLKIKLLQPTIENLLPKEGSEEGHDVQSVLGRPLGPLSCVVSHLIRDGTSSKDSVFKEIYLQQVSLCT